MTSASWTNVVMQDEEQETAKMRKAVVTTITGLLALVCLAPAAHASVRLNTGTSACVTSDLHGVCGPYSTRNITLSDGYNTYVSNNGWACGSPGSCGPQTLTAVNPGSWSVASKQAAGNTGVLTYPEVQQVFTDTTDTDPLISSFKYVYSSFTESMPAVSGLDAEAGYDIWLTSTSGPSEIMVWVDNIGRGTGGARQIGKATIGGQFFKVLQYGGGEIIFSLDHNEHSGTVHILSTLHWLQRHGRVAAGALISQVDFGWEICSTGGHVGTFKVSRYTLHSH
jgi:hypothetical protein